MRRVKITSAPGTGSLILFKVSLITGLSQTCEARFLESRVEFRDMFVCSILFRQTDSWPLFKRGRNMSDTVWLYGCVSQCHTLRSFTKNEMNDPGHDLARRRKLETVALPPSLPRHRRARSPSHARAWPPPKGAAVAAAAACAQHRSLAAAARSHSSARTSRRTRSHLTRALRMLARVVRRLWPRPWGCLAKVLQHASFTDFLRPVFGCFVRAGELELREARCHVSLRRA